MRWSINVEKFEIITKTKCALERGYTVGNHYCSQRSSGERTVAYCFQTVGKRDLGKCRAVCKHRLSDLFKTLGENYLTKSRAHSEGSVKPFDF